MFILAKAVIYQLSPYYMCTHVTLTKRKPQPSQIRTSSSCKQRVAASVGIGRRYLCVINGLSLKCNISKSICFRQKWFSVLESAYKSEFIQRKKYFFFKKYHTKLELHHVLFKKNIQQLRTYPPICLRVLTNLVFIGINGLLIKAFDAINSSFLFLFAKIGHLI